MTHFVKERWANWLPEAFTVCVGGVAFAAIVLKELVLVGIYRKNLGRHLREDVLPAFGIVGKGEQERRTMARMKQLLLRPRPTLHVAAVTLRATFKKTI